MNDTLDSKPLLFSLRRDESTMLKGIAILLVLLGHAEIITMGGAGGVALFLILSGYGLHSSCESRGLDAYWRKRIQKVWLPYFFVGLLDVFLFKVRTTGALLCTLTGLDLGLIADLTMWYISYIFFWYLAYYAGAKLTGKLQGPYRRRLALTCLLVLSCVPCLYLARTGFWHRGSMSRAFFFCFPLGVIMSCLREFRVSRNLQISFWVAVLLGCSAYLCLPYLHAQTLTYFTAMSMAGAAIAVLQLLPVGSLPKRLLLWVGEYSYPIYLFEGLFLLCQQRWKESMPAVWMADIAFFAASCVCAVLYWTLYRAAEKRLRAQNNNTENTT